MFYKVFLASVITLSLFNIAKAQTNSSASNTTDTGATAVVYGSSGYQHTSIETVPGLATVITSPTASCQATYSGTAAAMGFGIGLSGSKTDKNCEDLEQIRATYNMQQQATAILMLCEFANYRKARALEGDPCPPEYGSSDLPQETVADKSTQAPNTVAVPDTMPQQPQTVSYNTSIYRPAYCNQDPSNDDAIEQADRAHYCSP